MHTFLTPDPITCEIRNSAGEVIVELTDTTTTTVTVTLSDGHPFGFLNNSTVVKDMMRGFDRWRNHSPSPAGDPAEPGSVEADQVELVNVQMSDGRLIVDTEPARNGMFSAFTVRISAPTGSSIRAKTGSSDIGISGVADRLEVRSASGDITVNRAEGAVVAQTSSGDVELAFIGADLDLRAVSGSVEIGAVGGNLHAQTTSGGLIVQDAGRDAKVRSVSGRVEVRNCRTGTTEITTVSGDIIIGVGAGVAAMVDLATVAGQAISEIDVHDQAGPGYPADNTADLRVIAKSTTGDISLRPALASV